MNLLETTGIGEYLNRLYASCDKLEELIDTANLEADGALAISLEEELEDLKIDIEEITHHNPGLH